MPYPEPTLYPEPSLYPDPGGTVETEPTPDAWIPSPTLVARLLRARLVEFGAHPVRDFTAETEPTRADVADLIDMQAPLVLMRTGPVGDGELPCSNAAMLRQAVATVIAYRVAVDIELSYVPEEVQESAAAANDIRRAQNDADLAALEQAIERCRASADDGGTGGESESRSDPAWRFGYVRPLRF
jgi:hypothetical protein